MNRIVILALGVVAWLSTNGQEAFTIQISPSALTSVPAVHSGAIATHQDRWIFLGGRRDGMHIMQGNQAFPEYFRNDSIYVVDPVTDTYLAAAMDPLPLSMFSPLCSANMQYYQDGNSLYMIGGYGYDDSTLSWKTFPSLIRIDLDCLVARVDSGQPVTSCFVQLIDSSMAVSGGALDKIDSTYYLVFGHRFDGRYSSGVPPIFYQQYTHRIKMFGIQDNGLQLSLTNYAEQIDTNVFHRRDFNLVPQIYPNGQQGFTAFGGVFQKQADLPFLTPIDITSDTVAHIASFNENLNQYTTASLPVYDSLNNYMHTIFFGGMSLYTFDTVTMTLVQDTMIPFVSTISRISRDPAGNLVESSLPQSMPGLLGTNAVFIRDVGVDAYDDRIINLNSISGTKRVGFVMGGIASDAPHVANLDPEGMSRPNAQVFEVSIDKSTSDVQDVEVKNRVNDLLLYPNPADDQFKITFSLTEKRWCSLALYTSEGRLVRDFFSGERLAGRQSFDCSLKNIQDGVYFCKIRCGNSSRMIRLIVRHRASQ